MTQASNLGKGGSNFNSSGQLSLTTGVTGILPVANGGTGGTSGQVYPGAGIANSTGSAWGTSYTTSGSGTVLALTTSPSFTTPNLGTPSALTLTNATGLPVGGISATGTPSSSNYLRGDGSWTAVPTTSPAGSNNYVQFNSSGSFGASANFQYNSPTLYLLGPTAGTSVNLLNLYLGGTRATGNQYGLVFTDSSSETNAAIWAYQYAAGNNAAALVFGTNAGVGGAGGISSTTERMRIDNGGNVGIGTSSPANKLHVYTTATATPLTIETNGSACYLNFRSTTSTTGFIGYGEGGTANMNFYTNNSEKMRIDSSGNVGIGTTSQGSRLEVKASGASVAQLQLTQYNSTDGWKINADDNGGPLRFIRQGASLNGEAMRIDNAGLLQFNNGYGSIATAYGCRAWVNFQGGNGSTAGTINGSGNVSSITVNSAGDYTVNFSSAMPDANYAVSGTSKQSSGTGTNVAAFWLSWNAAGASVVNASYVRVMSATTNQGVVTNSWQTHVVVHR